jgi:hypothetical protein
VVIIDCIEFNQRFRCEDVAADVAFLAMELDAVKRPDLAAGFLARFPEASDDVGLYGVLDFYLSYRAWVRGKVAAFLAADPTTSPDVRTSERAKARRLFGLARSFSGVPVDRPFLIAVGGVIGSGKSTLAAALGRELAVPVISGGRPGQRPGRDTRRHLRGAPLARAGGKFSGHTECRVRIHRGYLSGPGSPAPALARPTWRGLDLRRDRRVAELLPSHL